MLLNVLSRDADGCRAMRDLIRRCHESPNAKKAHRRRAWQLFRSLLNRKIVEFIPPTANGAYLRVNVELQEDFSMDQTLSLYLLETIPLLDPDSPDYALDLLTLVESILENPEVILRRQLDKLKDRLMAELKARGADYYERMDELDKLEHPKPKRDFIYSTFNAFADQHPWVGQENIWPKSIAREMFESFRSFGDYVRDYGLPRSEGLLLRHLSSVHKVLAQTVPDNTKTDAVREMELYLLEMIRQVDSSLLEEWEKMRDPGYRPRAATDELRPPEEPEAERDITRDTKAFTAAVRNRVFTFLRAVAIGEYEEAMDAFSPSEPSPGELWTADRLREALDQFHAGHERVCLDPEARNLRHTHVLPAEDGQRWRVQQMLIDPDGLNDWVAEFEVDLARSRAEGVPSLWLRRLGSLV
jgi:hypothetical protein